MPDGGQPEKGERRGLLGQRAGVPLKAIDLGPPHAAVLAGEARKHYLLRLGPWSKSVRVMAGLEPIL